MRPCGAEAHGRAEVGKMVLISSTSALGNRGQANYAAAKAGLQGMTRTLSIELGPVQRERQLVAPGSSSTDDDAATAERIGVPLSSSWQASSAQVPLRRAGQPEDVAGTIAFLCSEDAWFVAPCSTWRTGRGLRRSRRGRRTPCISAAGDPRCDRKSVQMFTRGVPSPASRAAPAVSLLGSRASRGRASRSRFAGRAVPCVAAEGATVARQDHETRRRVDRARSIDCDPVADLTAVALGAAAVRCRRGHRASIAEERPR